MVKYQPLIIKDKQPYNFPQKPEHIPPKNGLFFTNLIIASRGYGKTHLCLQLIKNIEKERLINQFFIISPSRTSDFKQKVVFEELENNPNYLVEYYNDFTEKNMKQIINTIEENIQSWHTLKGIFNILEKIKKNKSLTDDEIDTISEYIDFEDEDENVFHIASKLQGQLKQEYPTLMRPYPPVSYIFVDDCYSSKLMIKHQGENIFTRFFIRHRHYYTSISLLVQSINGIPRSIRSNTILYFIFPSKSTHDKKIIYEENSNIFNSLGQYETIMRKVEQEDYGFLYIDSSSTRHPLVKIGLNGDPLRI